MEITYNEKHSNQRLSRKLPASPACDEAAPSPSPAHLPALSPLHSGRASALPQLLRSLLLSAPGSALRVCKACRSPLLLLTQPHLDWEGLPPPFLAGGVIKCAPLMRQAENSEMNFHSSAVIPSKTEPNACRDTGSVSHSQVGFLSIPFFRFSWSQKHGLLSSKAGL